MRDPACILLEETARELDEMIETTKSGGWSTNNVEAMEKRSQKIWAYLGKYGK
jgi:hypothetical protein